MAADKTNNLTIFLQEIADAIRYVKGTSDPINPQDFANLILSLAEKILGNIDDNNVITLLSNMVADDTYTLKYNDKNNNVIENFADICTLTVNGTDVSYNDLIDVNIPPYLAESIGVYTSEGTRIGMIEITKFKPNFGERLYRVGLLSDVHDYEGSSAEPSDDFRTALSLFNNKEDVVMTCITGDISQNGTTSEFQMFKDDVEALSPTTPVYTTSGNHDCGSGSGGEINEATWSAYTGQKLVFELSRTLDNGKTDHFLFLGMSSWSLGSNGTPYSTENIDWLETKLKEYRNERCFVFTHLFFPDRAGNLNEIYPSYNWLQGTQLTRLQSLCDKYTNSIWFSGHSHWKWYLQKYQDRANIYRKYNDDGTPSCGWCVHIPSCASPIDSNGSTRVEKPLESEGGVLDVYENYVDIRGIDLKNNLYLPIATYRLDTTLREILDFIGISTENFTHLQSYTYDTNKNGVDISGNTTNCPYAEYDQNTNTLSITFDNYQQKLLFQHDLIVSGQTTQSQIHFSCESATYWHGDVEVTNDSRYSTIVKNGIGWYLTDSTYSLNTPNNGVYATYPTRLRTSIFGYTNFNGIQFNCSESKYYTPGINAGLTDSDLFPITIKMKNISLAVSQEASE